ALQARNSTIAMTQMLQFSKTVLPFLVGVTTLDTEKRGYTMLWVIVLAQGYVAYDLNESYFIEGYNRLQDAGFGGMDNNPMGISLVTAIGSALALALVAKTRIAQFVAGAAVLFILHATLLSFSRGAMLGLIVVAIMTFAIMPKKPKYLVAIALLLLISYRLTGKELVARFST